MTIKTKLSALTVATTFLFGAAVSQAMAEDCHRGTLDAAYCDRNMDQVADLPLDEKDWVDPKTIIFTYTPVEDPAVYANIWTPLLRILKLIRIEKLYSSPWSQTRHN